MTANREGFDPGLMQANMDALAANPYPGRGIIWGVTADGQSAMQAYWLMGRSTNSRNRVLRRDQSVVTAAAHDPDKVKDPRLTLYDPMSTRVGYDALRLYVVSNGRQTGDVARTTLTRYRQDDPGTGFRQALHEYTYEPDNPHYTPRITTTMTAGLGGVGVYLYSRISRNTTTDGAEHTFGGGDMKDIPPGAGLCFHTYSGDGDPLPSFQGSPYAVPIVGETAAETAEALWGSLDGPNMVALAVRRIDMGSGLLTDTHIINQLERTAA
jgi:IMP cyclohydrolase